MHHKSKRWDPHSPCIEDKGARWSRPLSVTSADNSSRLSTQSKRSATISSPDRGEFDRVGGLTTRSTHTSSSAPPSSRSPLAGSAADTTPASLRAGSIAALGELKDNSRRSYFGDAGEDDHSPFGSANDSHHPHTLPTHPEPRSADSSPTTARLNTVMDDQSIVGSADLAPSPLSSQSPQHRLSERNDPEKSNSTLATSPSHPADLAVSPMSNSIGKAREAVQEPPSPPPPTRPVAGHTNQQKVNAVAGQSLVAPDGVGSGSSASRLQGPAQDATRREGSRTDAARPQGTLTGDALPTNPEKKVGFTESTLRGDRARHGGSRAESKESVNATRDESKPPLGESVFGESGQQQQGSAGDEEEGSPARSRVARHGYPNTLRINTNFRGGGGEEDDQGSSQAGAAPTPTNTARMRDRARSMLLSPMQMPHVLSQGMPSPRAPLSTLTMASPLVVSASTLEEPLKEEEPVKSRHKGDLYFVRQTRSTLGRTTFDTSFLSLRVNDMVTFEWFDSAQHVFETNKSYDKVVPGGRSSTTHLPEGMQKDKELAILVPEAQDEVTGKMSFTTRFTVPGDYYFVCTKDKRRMRLHIQVVSERTRQLSCGLATFLAALGMICVIVVVVLVLAYWLQKKDFFLSREDAVSESQYDGVKKLQKLITLYVFPWLATGILILLMVIIVAVVQAIVRAYRPARQGSWHRGVKLSVRQIVGLCFVILCLGMVVLLFVAYGLQLNVMDGINNFALQLTSGISSTLNAFSTVVLQVEWLAQEGPNLLPSVDFPYDDVNRLLRDIGDILNETERWTTFGEDLAQGAFRILPILLFLTLQLGLFASAMAVGAVVMRYPRATAAIAWILAVCVGIYACAVGVVWAESKLMSSIYSSAVVFRDNPANFPDEIGLANDSIVVEIFSLCDVTDIDVRFISEYVNEILQGVNEKLSPEAQEQFSEVLDFFSQIVPVTLDALVNFTSYVQSNLDLMAEIVAQDGAAVNDFFSMEVVPYLQVIIGVVNTLKGLVDCRIIRDIVANAIPVLKNDVQSYNTGLLAFMFIIFGVSVPTFALGAFTAYALVHPRKVWYEPRTGRWFRLRYAYKIHRRTLTRPSKHVAQGTRWLDELQRRAIPFMHQLLTVKLVCYSASVLMFFDSILLVLFNDIAKSISAAPLLRAVSYLGCVQLIFLLAAALFRQAWARWVFHGLALLVVVGCLVVALVQTIAGFVKFGNCFEQFTFTEADVLGAEPYYDNCPVTYIGHQLEVAVYGLITFFNSVTLVVTLILLIVHERKLKASFQRRHYTGVFSSLERACPRLSCIFADYLNVKRILVGFFIFIVVVLLILLSVVDNARFRIVGTSANSVTVESTIVQVIDPTVGCNGDPRYCDLRVSEYIWACAHNAHSSLEDGFVVADHYYNISHQLYAGIRNFMIDLWYDKINVTEGDEEDVYVCHKICVAGRRPFRAIAQEYNAFLEKYPQQVIMIILEQYVNSSDIGRIMHEVGLDRYVWYNTQVPPGQNPSYVWPTFHELIDSNQRLMIFNDRNSLDNYSLNAPEWLYYAFDFQFENSYNTLDVSQWRCNIGRGWCYIPPSDDENVTNSSSSSSDALSSEEFSFSVSMSCESTESASCVPMSTATPEPEAELPITNCSDYPGPWLNGSDAYYAEMGSGIPPPVASKLSTMNHFITNGIASPVQASKANVPASIQLTTFNCSSHWNQVINILAFDYWTIANPLATIEAMNKNLVRYGKRYNYKDAWSMMLFGNNAYTIKKGVVSVESAEDP